MTMHDLQAEPLTAEDRGVAAVAVLLESLGYDPESERLRETPARVAACLAALVEREPLPPFTFFDGSGYDGAVVMRDIPFHSLCEHHLLPFRGVATIGYLPGDRVVGLSALARVVEYLARDLQLQERITVDIADWLERELQPRGLGVLIDAEHMCMSMRGVGTPGTRTTTSVFRGEFARADLA